MVAGPQTRVDSAQEERNPLCWRLTHSLGRRRCRQICYVTARYDEKYYNRCYRNLLPVILTDIPRPLPHIPYTLTQRAHSSAGEKRGTRHMQHSALHSSVRTTKHPVRPCLESREGGRDIAATSKRGQRINQRPTPHANWGGKAGHSRRSQRINHQEPFV